MSTPGLISIPLKKVSEKAERNKTEKSEATETERETPMNSLVFCRYELSVSTQQTTQQAHLINLSLISPVYSLCKETGRKVTTERLAIAFKKRKSWGM